VCSAGDVTGSTRHERLRRLALEARILHQMQAKVQLAGQVMGATESGSGPRVTMRDGWIVHPMQLDLLNPP
jgi:hypothetical protein